MTAAKTYAVIDRIRERQAKLLRRAIRGSMVRAYSPPPKMSLSDWADKYRYLSPEAAAQPGKWKTSNEPMAKGMMDALTDPLVGKITVQAASQVAKTELLLNAVAYYAHGDPAPILMVQPSIELAEKFAKDRLEPMIRDTRVLTKLFDDRSRNSSNTLDRKGFPGGYVALVGANAPRTLASRPIRVVLMDEIDGYPISSGREGDPVSLAEKRTTMFHNRKIALVSTPLVKGHSRIEASYNEGDGRRFCVPCPHCGVRQHLKWSSVKWSNHDPSTAHYECDTAEHDRETGELGCGKPWTEAERVDAITAAGALPDGGWIAQRPFKGHASFHASQLSSKRVPLSRVVAEFLEVKAFPDRLKTWTNTVLAETFEEGGERADPDTLYGRREPYDAARELPPEVGLITIGVDIQRNRWEAEVVGWGSGEESWSLEYKAHYADPSTPGYWQALDDFISQTWRHPTGAEFRAEGVCVDSGDNTQAVYDFCRPRYARRVFPIKGYSDSRGKPIWPKKATRNAGKKIDVFMLGLDNAKADTQSRLMMKEPGPGYCHFPLRDEYDEPYFKGLTIEKAVTKYKYGVPYREWWCPEGGRNEPWDCRIYAYAALKSCVVNIGARLAQLRAYAAQRAGSPEPMPAPVLAKRGRRVRSNGVSA